MYDANVLYPAFLRDLLLRLARAGAVSPRWTDRIHDEWIRGVLARRNDLSLEKLQRVRQLMEAAVPGALVEGYEHRITAICLPDPDDRHVLAAAIESGAEIIVTFNGRDFPHAILSPWRVEARHPDDFLIDRLRQAPTEVLAAFRAHRAALTRPAFSRDEYIEKLDHSGLEKTAERLRQLRSDL
ncbi:MAG TPA: PIN domain-containing protein [Longimicrobium sp.]